MVENNRRRTIVFYKHYFSAFFIQQRLKVQNRIIWTFDLIEQQDRIPEKFFNHLEGTSGLYEIRVQVGNDEIRIFCFFDKGQLIVIVNGFYKKSQKTPSGQLKKALQIKKEYEEEKKQS